MARSGVATAADVTALPSALLGVYSLDILHNALGVMRFADFAVKHTELGALPGETITFTKYAQLSRGGKLTESTALATKALSATQQSLTVTEYGNAAAITEKLKRLSYDDMLREMAVLLGQDYAVVNDLEFRDAALGAANTIYGGSATSVGTLQDVDTLSTEELNRGVEILQTANAPKFNNDYYVCFTHPHGVSYLRRDPDWVAANNYAQTRALFNGELGRWNDIIFVGTTHMSNGAAAATDPGYEAALDGTGADGQNCYRTVLFGDAFLGWAEALPAEMRTNGIEDFGRTQALAWYAIQGFGLLFDTYGVEIVHS